MEFKCKNCEHSLICKFKLDYEKFVLEDLKVPVPTPFVLDVVCPHYRYTSCQTHPYSNWNHLCSTTTDVVNVATLANVAEYEKV